MIFMRRWRATQARILRLKHPDSPVISRLHEASFARGWSESEIESLMTSPAVDVIGAKLGSALLGMVMARTAADEGEILTIAIHEQWRGLGLAQRLLSEALLRLMRAGARRCFLEVASDNLPALMLYARHDFTEVGRRKGYYQAQGGGDALILSRPLIDRFWTMQPPDAVETD